MTIEVINGDITTLEGWAREAVAFRESILSIAAALNRPFSGCGVFGMCELETGKETEGPIIYHVMTEYRGDQAEIAVQKKRFLDFLRALAIATKSFAAISHMETWYALHAVGSDHDPRPVRDRPGRKEGIFAAFDHADFGVHGWMSEITHPNGKRAFSPWIECGSNIAGEMVNVVPNRQFWHDAPARFPDIQARAREIVMSAPQFEMLTKPLRRAEG